MSRRTHNKLVVLGAGESGTGAAVLGKKEGWDVFVSDNGQIGENYKDTLSAGNITWEENTHTWAELKQATTVVKSPGIRDDAPPVLRLKKERIPVISEIEFAAAYTGGQIVAITGSNGKTTTAALTHHIMKNAGLDVCLAGNVGNSFAMEVAREDHDYYVLELSSFQLDGIIDFRPHIAVILNITPDHLDRYNNSMPAYVGSKMRIAGNQHEEDYLIHCADDDQIISAMAASKPRSRKIPFSIYKKKYEGAYLKFPLKNPLEGLGLHRDNELIVELKNQKLTMAIYQLALKGKHNLYNSMASTITSRILEIDNEIIRNSLTDFQNVEHRLEFVTKVHGISFINDSKATNVNAAWYGLEATSAPIVWIVGGEDKGNKYRTLLPLVKEKVKAIVCLGLDNEKIRKNFNRHVDEFVETDSMSKAIIAAYSLAKRGDSVLLSPACASFDLFESYEDRGRQFKECVRAL